MNRFACSGDKFEEDPNGRKKQTPPTKTRPHQCHNNKNQITGTTQPFLTNEGEGKSVTTVLKATHSKKKNPFTSLYGGAPCIQERVPHRACRHLAAAIEHRRSKCPGCSHFLKKWRRYSDCDDNSRHPNSDSNIEIGNQ